MLLFLISDPQSSHLLSWKEQPEIPFAENKQKYLLSRDDLLDWYMNIDVLSSFI